MSDLIARQAEMFGNRLKKNARRLDKWARKRGLSCYRLYDRDIPEVPVSVDRYDDALYIAVYARTRLKEAGPEWTTAIQATAAQTLNVSPDAVFVKTRERQRGASQYEKLATRRAEREVSEYGLRFVVNLSDYLDTGLFLDHRDTRQLVREESEGKRVLNLFAYTGAFSVYAAAGGAAFTHTVDMSNTYCAWAERHLRLNGFGPPAHVVERADVLAFLRQAPAQPYDLIVVDPPSFSNSKKMTTTFDVQRDHVELLTRVAAWGKAGSVVYFSNNRRGFKLDELSARFSETVELTSKTTTEDFRRNPLHRSWRLVI